VGVAGKDAVYYDPYKVEIVKNPYPVYRRLREESPLYYNKEYDFYAVSRYDDVKQGLSNHQTFSSARGGILELIKANVEMPPGTFIFEDPPLHTVHRGVVARIFTPRRMNGLDVMVREFTARTLDALVGRDSFDVVADIGAQIPMRVIGMLLGIPEQDLQGVRERADARLHTESGAPMSYDEGFALAGGFEEYIDWRVKNPSDDVMTELLSVEFTDETGKQRRLTRDEILTFVNVLAGAGNETTNRLIGWTAKTLAEHPDQRRELVQDPALIPEAIEEVLRFEPIGTHVGRYVASDVQYYGQTVPQGSAILFLVGSANRDQRRFPDGDRFDIHRDRAPHVTFGSGIHTCPGNVLARLEGRIVLEELLKRFPEWEIDLDNAQLSSTSTVRGWETLPAYTGPAAARAAAQRSPAPVEVAPATEASVEGEWTVTIKGPTGPMATTLVLERVDGVLTGTQSGEGATTPINEAGFENGNIFWANQITKPMKLKLEFTGVVEGDSMNGKVKTGFMGSFPFTAVRV
jgi:cytochrome P450